MHFILDSRRTHNENAPQGLIPLDFMTFLYPRYVLTHNDEKVSSLSVAAVVFVGSLVMSYPGVRVVSTFYRVHNAQNQQLPHSIKALQILHLRGFLRRV